MRRSAFTSPIIGGLLLATAAGCAETHSMTRQELVNGPDAPLVARVPLECQTLLGSGVPELDANQRPPRISGDVQIPLRSSTMRRLRDADVRQLSVRTRYCVDTSGRVSCIDFGGHDRPRDLTQTFIDALQQWRFDRFLPEGQPSGFCRMIVHNFKIS